MTIQKEQALEAFSQLWDRFCSEEGREPSGALVLFAFEKRGGVGYDMQAAQFPDDFPRHMLKEYIKGRVNEFPQIPEDGRWKLRK